MNQTNYYSHPADCLGEGLGETHGLVILDILSFIKSKLTVESLYLLGMHCEANSSRSLLFPNDFNYQTLYQLDLLVISKHIPANSVADLSSCINGITKGVYNVTLLCHKASEVKNIKSSNRYFFNMVRQNGMWLAGFNNLLQLQPNEQLLELNMTKVELFCKERCIAAKHLLAMESQLESDSASLLEVSFLHQAVEQLCIALIYKYMHYYPCHFHLGYLLDLCKGFTAIGEEVFPRQSTHDQEIFQILCSTISDTRFKKLDSFKRFQVELLEYRCWEFFDRTEALLFGDKVVSF